MRKLPEQEARDALKRLRNDILQAVDQLCIEERMGIDSWTRVIDGKLLPRLSPDFPLTVAICGGGSSGKSTLFNSLAGERLSPSGGTAGINRRILVAANEELLRQTRFFPLLFEPFECTPEPLKDPLELTVPGCPLFVLNNAIPRNLVIMDTPDFDTGSRGGYINRDVARKALESADVLIYIFTNSNYSNRDNTDFISQMLTGIGVRKCFLAYRVYPSFEDSEVLAHAMTVARNLYGDEADRYVLGIYRIDEDNAIAAGDRLMELRPVRDQDPPFMQALGAIDPRVLRPELLTSMLRDVLGEAQKILGRLKNSFDELCLYHDALQTAQSHCVHEALLHFPMDLLMRRFAEIWVSTDPGHVKAMREAGKVLELPFKALIRTAKWAKNKLSTEKLEPPPPTEDYKVKLEEDLLNALNRMHYQAVGPEISVAAATADPVAGRMMETTERVRAFKGLTDLHHPHIETDGTEGKVVFFVNAHPVVFYEQEKLRKSDWKPILESILSRKNLILSLSEDIEYELRNLADAFRRGMDFWSKARQSFSAFLNVLPATVAVTYILSTGDPVGAAGIKVKLTGLFGLHDLYALLALPATTGLKKADQKQLEAVLGPIAQTWLNSKLKTVRELFESEITGGIIRAALRAVDQSENLIHEIESSMEICGKAMING